MDCKYAFYAAYQIIRRLERDKAILVDDDCADYILHELEKLHAAACEDCKRKLDRR